MKIHTKFDKNKPHVSSGHILDQIGCENFFKVWRFLDFRIWTSGYEHE